MIATHRRRFNAEFTEARHRAFVEHVEAVAGHVGFPLAETPCFLPATLVDRLVSESQAMIAQLFGSTDYLHAAAAVVPPSLRLARGETWPTCIAVDFGLVEGADGVEGRLVELQAFPSLYGFQMLLGVTAQEHYGADRLTPFIGGLSRDAYVAAVRRAIVGDHDPSEVVLVEIDPQHQKTLPDFVVTEQVWGVRAVDLSQVERDGRRLFVRDAAGTRRPIAKIYNRVIPDELMKKGLSYPFDLTDPMDVEWAGGPDWYFRLSKFAIPWLDHPWVPKTYYLHETPVPPGDRERWLLKPLFSFAGGGIVFAPTDAQLDAIPVDQRQNYIVQERQHFTPVIDTPHGLTQVEIRIMMVRDGDGYRALIPLLRMGRGKMMGVDHNKGLKWVGGSAALIDPGA